MNAAYARKLILMAALAGLPAGMLPQSAQAPSTATAAPQGSQPQTTTQSKPKKKPDEPIDPNTSAGVRGTGAKHIVRVTLKGKPAEGARVLVKNSNGTVAASCTTSDLGECQVEVGADSYIVNATRDGRAGTVFLSIDDATGPIVIRLARVKTESSVPKP